MLDGSFELSSFFSAAADAGVSSGALILGVVAALGLGLYAWRRAVAAMQARCEKGGAPRRAPAGAAPALAAEIAPQPVQLGAPSPAAEWRSAA